MRALIAEANESSGRVDVGRAWDANLDSVLVRRREYQVPKAPHGGYLGEERQLLRHVNYYYCLLDCLLRPGVVYPRNRPIAE